MASKTIGFAAPSGLTLTASLFSLTSDTAITSSATCTEATNAKAWYTFTSTDVVSSAVHRVVVKEGSTAIAFYYVYLTDTANTFPCTDTPTVINTSGYTGADVQQFGGTAGTFSSGRPEVNATHWGGTAVGSALVRGNLIQISGSSVNTASAQLGVNVVQISGDSTAADNLESYTDGTTPMPVNATQISGDATAADNCESFFDGTGYAGGTTKLQVNTVQFAGSSGAVDLSSLGYLKVNVVEVGAGTDATELALAAANTNSAVHGNLALKTLLDTIEAQTDEIGVAGAGLTAIPWNSAWDAEVQSEVDDALIAKGLDHLVFTSVTGTDVADNSIIARMVSKSATADWDTFAQSTDSLEAIRDNMGTAQTGDAYAIVNSGTHGNAALKTLIDAVDDYVDTEVAAIKAKTDNLPSDPADASVVAGLIAALEAKVDTIDDFLDTEIAAIKAKTDNLPSDPADASDIAASFTTVNTKLDTIDDFLDTEIAAIKAKTDNLPSDPADASDIAASFSTLTTKVDTIDDLLDTEVAAIKTVVDAIKTVTDVLPDSGMLTSLATASSQTTIINDIADVQAVVDAIEATIDGMIADEGTAQGGAAGSITLRAGASATDDYYNNAVVNITAGTGVGQARQITDYNGTTKVATVEENWATAPDNTSEYQVIGRVV